MGYKPSEQRQPCRAVLVQHSRGSESQSRSTDKVPLFGMRRSKLNEFINVHVGCWTRIYYGRANQRPAASDQRLSVCVSCVPHFIWFDQTSVCISGSNGKTKKKIQNCHCKRWHYWSSLGSDVGDQKKFIHFNSTALMHYTQWTHSKCEPHNHTKRKFMQWAHLVDQHFVGGSNPMWLKRGCIARETKLMSFARKDLDSAHFAAQGYTVHRCAPAAIPIDAIESTYLWMVEWWRPVAVRHAILRSWITCKLQTS